ncbi:MAG: hypothetical protein IKK43_02685 [Clostridia bacterium]|nr:hypothetical protein [Clostridia bacterium]
MSCLTAKEISELNINKDELEFDRLYALTDDKSLLHYVKNHRRGFIRNRRVITEPFFVPDARIINSEYVCTDFCGFFPNYNKGVLLNSHTGEIEVKGFGAWGVKDNYFMFRVNGKEMSDHRWGIFSLTEHELIHEANMTITERDEFINSL